MTSTERLETSLLKDWICSEIRALGAQQEALLHGAAFVDLTRDETDEYNQRAAQIADLVKQLSLLYPSADSILKGRHEQKAEKAARDSRESD